VEREPATYAVKMAYVDAPEVLARGAIGPRSAGPWTLIAHRSGPHRKRAGAEID
jgi:hypothetical protein